jgi:hypothetical protein
VTCLMYAGTLPVCNHKKTGTPVAPPGCRFRAGVYRPRDGEWPSPPVLQGCVFAALLQMPRPAGSENAGRCERAAIRGSSSSHRLPVIPRGQNHGKFSHRHPRR